MHPILFHVGAILVPSYGALAALGVVVALMLTQYTARVAGLDAARVWNLCVVTLFAALLGSRLLLVLVNWRVVLHHPSWILLLAMIHHPLVSAVGASVAVACACLYAYWRRMPLLALADALAAPVALGLVFEQIGTLLAGSGYGLPASPGLPWAVKYTDPLAARWSGTPLDVPLHPVQAYAALGFLVLAILLVALLHVRRRAGDVAGLWLLGSGVTVYITELWRDRDGRGSVLGGALDGPQIAAIAMVLLGGFLLRERKRRKQPAPEHAEAAGNEPDSPAGEAANQPEHE